ncbi:uncharacterized protein TNCV_4930241 [Trichonephila clavipes]|nr:uncharacterized protein TNCV_4930241 [Trichonephila clavipes]
MSEKAHVDHIVVRLEPQVQDYVEVRNPQNTVQLLEVLSKFGERYSGKAIRGSRNSNNVEGRGWNERRMSNVGNDRGNWRNSEVVRRSNNGRNDYRGNYENRRQGNQWFESRNRFQNEDRRFNDRGYQFRNGGQNDDFSRGDQRNRGSSENFHRGDRRQMGRLNVLKVSDVKRNPIESKIGEKVHCAIIKDLVLSSRDQLIEEQRTDPELDHIYRYLENPEDSSVKVTIWVSSYSSLIIRITNSSLVAHLRLKRKANRIDACKICRGSESSRQRDMDLKDGYRFKCRLRHLTMDLSYELFGREFSD